ncbi:acyl-CoA N-acyltransferase, partial [Infundibulicybe gibba]
SPRSTALNAQLVYPTSCVAYLLFGAGFLTSMASKAFSRRLLGGIVSFFAASFFVGHRWWLSRSFTSFCEGNLRADLGNISAHYGMEDGSLSGPSGFWVAEAGEQDSGNRIIVGCVGLDHSLGDGPRSAQLRRMAVSPTYQRRGIGAMLVRTLIAHARRQHIHSIVLSSNMYQGPAMSMYRKLGWVEEGRFIVPKIFPTFWVTNFRLQLDDYSES